MLTRLAILPHIVAQGRAGGGGVNDTGILVEAQVKGGDADNMGVDPRHTLTM